MQRLARIVKWLAVVAVAVLVAALAILLTLDVDDYRDEIAGRLSTALGREVALGGELALDLGLSPRLVARDIAIANPAWASRDHMARAERLAVEVGLLPLLGGRLAIREVILDGAQLALERDSRGRANWSLGPPSEDAAPPPAPVEGGPDAGEAARGLSALPDIQHVRLRDARLSYIEAGVTVAELALAELDAAARLDSQARLNAAGRWREIPFTARLEGGVLREVAAPAQPWPVSLRLTLFEDLDLTATGMIAEPLRGQGIELDLAIAGEDPARLAPLTGGTAPPLPGPYRLAGRLTDFETGLRLADIEAALGRSQLAGALSLALGGTRPRLTGELRAAPLDLAEIAAAGPEPAPPPETEEEEVEPGRVIPELPLPDGAALARLDAELDLVAETLVLTPEISLSEGRARLVLADRRLDLSEGRARLGPGRLEASLRLDGRRDPPALTVAGGAEGLDYGALLAALGATDRVEGRLSDLAIRLEGQGADLRAALAGAAGRATLALGASRIDAAAFELGGSELVGRILTSGAEAVTVLHCAAARMTVTDGLGRLAGLVADTRRLTLGGVGGVNLADESLDFLLRPRPKQAALVNLAIPVRITGHLAAPKFRPDPRGLAQGALSLLGGAVNPAGLDVPYVPPPEGGWAAAEAPAGICEAALDDPRPWPEDQTPSQGLDLEALPKRLRDELDGERLREQLRAAPDQPGEALRGLQDLRRRFEGREPAE